MARDQRTRLNAELAHQYGAQVPTGAMKPGKGSVTEHLVDDAEHEAQEAEHERDAEVDVAEGEQEVAAEPKKSIFELPRKEPSRPSLADVAPAPTAAAEPSKK